MQLYIALVVSVELNTNDMIGLVWFLCRLFNAKAILLEEQ